MRDCKPLQNETCNKTLEKNLLPPPQKNAVTCRNVKVKLSCFHNNKSGRNFQRNLVQSSADLLALLATSRFL